MLSGAIKTMDHDHAGLPCSIVQGADVCAAIDTVLTVIRDKHPEDFDRLRGRIVCFEVVPPEERGDDEKFQTLGEWKQERPRMVDVRLEHDGAWSNFRHPEDNDQCRGKIALHPMADVGTVAHELGHAMQTDDDLRARYSPNDEWDMESVADYHAFRWGFAEMIKADTNRDPFHHPLLPGGEPTFFRGSWWRVDDNFVFHYCPVCDIDADCDHALEEYLSNKPAEATREQLAGFDAFKKRASKYKITTVTPDDG